MRVRRRRRASIAARLAQGMFLALTVSTAAAQSGAGVDAARAQAVALAREGSYESALAQLELLRETNPDDLALRNDYIAVLSWADRDARVLELAATTPSENAPGYVQQAIAKSARNLRRYELAAAWYEQALAEHPDNLENRFGLAMTYADQGYRNAAHTVLDEAPPPVRATVPFRLARAYVLRTGDEQLPALAEYDAILAAEPDHFDALRGKALVLRSLLLPAQALALAVRHPGILTDAERARLEVDEVALRVRLTAKTPYPPAQRHARFAATLSAIDEHLAANPSGDAHTVLALDRIVALADDNRAAEAIAAFESLASELPDAEAGTPEAALPAYALAATGKAYLQEQRPEDALRVLRWAVAANPEEIELRFALIYAYLDLEDYESAFALTRALTEELPLVNTAESSTVVKGNPDRVRAELVAGIAEAYGDQLESAQHRFEALLAEAPNNLDLRHELANVYRWRGWLDKSLFEYDQVLAIDEQLLSARLGQAHAQIEAHEYEAVDATLAEIAAAYAREPAVENLAEAWELHNQSELDIDARRGDSSGGTFGNDFWSVDTRWFTAPKAYHYRGFVHLHDAYAEFPEGEARRKRIGAGVEYRGHRFTARGELSGSRDGGDAGLAGDMSWRMSDTWHVGGLVELLSNQTQLRGHRVGVQSDLLGLSASLAPDEQRSLSLQWRYQDLSDGNTIERIFADGRRRIVNRPRWKLEATAELSTSRADRDDLSYFSPTRDFAAYVGARHEWRLYRRYDKSLRQTIELKTGRYDQAGFASGGVWRIGYDLLWRPGSTLLIGLGAERSRDYYDGNREYTNAVVATVNARL